MLKGIDPILNAEVLHALRAMGHGDDLILCDTNFPAQSVARRTMHGRLLRIDAPLARVAQAVQQAWGVDASPSAVLAAPTVGGFAAVVQAAIDEADALSHALQSEIDALSDEEVARLLGKP